MDKLKEFIKSHINTEKLDKRVDAVKRFFRVTGRKIRLFLGYRITARLNTISGKNPKDFHYVKGTPKGKEKYLVIRSEYPRMGLFSTLIWSVPAIFWADKYGFIPVIDWDLPFTFNKGEIGHFDYWSKFFDQKILPSECPKKGKTLVSATNAADYNFHKKTCEVFSAKSLEDKEFTERVKKLIKEYVFIPKKELIEGIDPGVKDSFSQSRVVGVMIREEFCQSSKDLIIDPEQKMLLKDHPTIPEIADIIAKVKEMMDEWGCDRVFLSCACSDTVDMVREELGDKLICLDRPRKTLKGQYIETGTRAFSEYETESLEGLFPPDEVYDKESSYLQEIYMLSKCDSLIYSISGGYLGAMLLKDGEYNNTYMIPYV